MKKLEPSDLAKLGAVDLTLLQDKAEIQLHDAIKNIETDCISLFANGDYDQGLKLLATLRDSVDAFFDQVMVMADDEKLRNNRFSLLQGLQKLFLEVADISVL